MWGCALAGFCDAVGGRPSASGSLVSSADSAQVVPLKRYRGRPIADLFAEEDLPYVYWALSQRGVRARYPRFCAELERRLYKHLRERQPTPRRGPLVVVSAAELIAGHAKARDDGADLA